jgi:hypothetical protein
MNLRYYVKTIRLLNLHCNRTDDNDDNNSPKLNKSFLTVENGRFHILGSKLMMMEVIGTQTQIFNSINNLQ